MGKSKRIVSLFSIIFLIFMSIVPVSVSAASNVKLNKSKISIIVGRRKQLEVLNTTKNVSWSSSDKSIAKVSKNGRVKARKSGKVVITATIGKQRKLDCVVTVKEKPELWKYAKVCVGEKQRLVLTGTAKKVSWKSSNKKKVKVNKKGVITGVSEGYANITAMVGKKKLRCRVLVELAVTPVKSEVSVGNSKIVNVSHGAEKIFCESSDPTIATVVIGRTTVCKCWKQSRTSDVVVYGLKDGTVDITIKNNTNDEEVTFKAVVEKPKETTGKQKMIDYLINNGTITEEGCLLASRSYEPSDTQPSALAGEIEYDPLKKDVTFSCVDISDKVVVEWNLMATEDNTTEYYITMWINVVEDGKTSENFVTAKIDSTTFSGEKIVYEDGWDRTSVADSLQTIANTATNNAITLLGDILKLDMGLSWSEIGFSKLG